MGQTLNNDIISGLFYGEILIPGSNKLKLLRQVENISAGRHHHVPQDELHGIHEDVSPGKFVTRYPNFIANISQLTSKL